MTNITLWQLAPSFNSRKVRYALGIKGVPYTTREVGDENVHEVVSLSGQPMTPVLDHNGVVMFDSGAIVRYIDANIPGPRLFSSNIDEMRQIEQWESNSRQLLLAPYLRMSGQVRTGEMNQTILDESKQSYFDGARQVEQALNEHGVLIGDSLTAADIFCACYLAYGFLTEAEAGKRPPMVWALNNISLAQDMPALSTWFERLRAVESASQSVQ